MFLNNLAKPIKVPNITHLSAKQHLDGVPVFLCSAQSLNQPLWNSWSGCMYSSKQILDSISRNLNYPIADGSSCILNENVSTAVQYNKNNVNVTMFPVLPGSADKVMFLIDDDYVKRLYTENLNGTLDALMHNKTLRKAIRDQIDILYIDDSIFLEAADIAGISHPTEFQLLAWTSVIRPIKIVGMNGSNIPKYILANCKEVDLYSEES